MEDSLYLIKKIKINKKPPINYRYTYSLHSQLQNFNILIIVLAIKKSPFSDHPIIKTA